MFGCNFDDGDRRQEISKKLATDNKYKRRLEKTASKSALRSKLALVEGEIVELNMKKEELHLNPDFEKDLKQLNKVKGSLSELAVKQSSLQLRYNLIEEAVEDLKAKKSDIDTQQLELIYRQASAMIPKLQHTFEDLLSFHNEMLERKANFLSAELPQLKQSISACNTDISALRQQERLLAERLQQSATIEALDELVAQLNLKYQEKGALEQQITQIEEVDKTIALNEEILKDIDNGLFSQSKQDLVQKQLDKFNQYYSSISKRIYGESYAIEYSLVKNKEGKNTYKFAPFATDNFSTGKKQGEIACFDMAYIMFADDEKIPCLHFILNDQKELVHDNQLSHIGELANDHVDIQYVVAILYDKLPDELKKEENIVLKLSQHSKLFKIEE